MSEISSSNLSALNSPRRCHVVIVGAGCAGLACAHQLLKHNKDLPQQQSFESNIFCHQRDLVPPGSITTMPRDSCMITNQSQPLIILEARDRVGGRICSIQKTVAVGDTTIPIILEQGAAWIHGLGSYPQWNPMTALILEQSFKSNKRDPNNINTIDQDMDILKRELDWISPMNPWTKPFCIMNHLGTISNQHQMALFYNGTQLDAKSTELRMALDIYQSILQSITDENVAISNLDSCSSLAQALLQATAINPLYNMIGSNHETKAFVDGIIHLHLFLFQSWTACSLSDTHYSQAPFWDRGKQDHVCASNQSSTLYDPSSQAVVGGQDGDYPGWHCLVRQGMNSVLEPLLQQDVKESILLNQEVTRIESYNNKDRQDVVSVVTSSGLVVEADMCIVSIPLGCLKASIRNESKSILFSPPLSQSKQEAIEAIDVTSYTKIIVIFKEIFWPIQEPFIGLIFNTTERNTTSHNFPGQCLVLDNLYARRLGAPILEISLVAESSHGIKTKCQDEIKSSILSCIQMGLIGTKESVVDVFSMCVSLDIITQWDEDPFSCGAYTGPTINSRCEHFERLSEPEWEGKLQFIGEATNTSYTGSAHGALLSGYEMADKIKNKLSSVSLV